jgi:hypothetical protein
MVTITAMGLNRGNWEMRAKRGTKFRSDPTFFKSGRLQAEGNRSSAEQNSRGSSVIERGI